MPVQTKSPSLLKAGGRIAKPKPAIPGGRLEQSAKSPSLLKAGIGGRIATPKPAITGGRLEQSAQGTLKRFSDDGRYIGPERPYVEGAPAVRFVCTVYYITCLTVLCILNTAVLSLCHLFKFIATPVAKASSPEAREDLERRFDYIVGLVHETFAMWLTAVCRPVLGHPSDHYPAVDNVQPMVNENATAQQKETIENEMQLMHIDAEAGWWNQVRSLVGLEKKFVIGRAFIMCNHLSNADGVISRGFNFPSGAKILYKGTLGKYPFFGWNFSLSGDIAVEFAGKKGSLQTAAGFKEKLNNQLDRIAKNRLPVMLFPEGTRSRYRRMAPFRLGMFEYALKHDVPIWPTAIYGSQYAMPVGDILMNPSNIKCYYSNQLIFPQGHTLDSFIAAVREEIISLLRTNVEEYDEEADAALDDFKTFKDLETLLVKET